MSLPSKGKLTLHRLGTPVLVSAVPPMLKTASNPAGLPIDVFDGLRAGLAANRSQFFLDVASGPFHGFNRPGATPSQGKIITGGGRACRAAPRRTMKA